MLTRSTTSPFSYRMCLKLPGSTQHLLNGAAKRQQHSCGFFRFPRAGRIFRFVSQSCRRSLKSSQPEPGICAGLSKGLVCYTTTGTSATSLTSRFNGSNTAPFDFGTMEQLLSFTMFLQSRIFVPLLAAAGALFLIGIFFLTLLKRHMKSTPNQNAANTRQTFRRVTNVCLWASTAFALSSAFAVGQTASALQNTTASTQSSIRIMSGTTLQILQWLTFAFSVTFAFGISSIFQSPNAGNKVAGDAPNDFFPQLPQ